MATTTEVEIKLTVDGSQPEKSVGSIKSQLKQANAELLEMREKFGDTSKEAVAAAKKVANLKDAIGDAKAMADAFNPDAKFKAFGQALQGVAGGFSAVQGAMGLLGSDSEDVEKALLKVNSAMALSQGINSVLEAKDGFKNLISVVKSYSAVQKIITTAQWLWNAAMAANPIGAVVVAITALIAGIVALTSYFMSNAKASRENAKAVKENAKALEQQQKANAKANDELNRAQSYQLAMAKANGETTASIRALELKLIDEKIATERASRETAINTFEKNKNALASLKQAGASDEVIKKQQETTAESLKYANEQTANLNKSLIDRQELQRKHNVEIATETTNANKEAIQKANQNAEEKKKKQEEENNKRKELTQTFANDLKALEDSNYLNAIADDNKRATEKLRIDYENEQKAIKEKGFLKEEEGKLLTQLEKKYQLDLADLKAEQKKKEDEEEKAKKQKAEDDARAKLEKEISFEEATFKIINDLRIANIKDEGDRARENEALKYQAEIDAALEALNNKEITQAQYDARAEALKLQHESRITDIEKSESEKKIAIAKAEKEAKEKIYNDIASALGTLSDVVGKETEAGKAFAIAQLVMTQAQSVAKQVSSMKTAIMGALATPQAIASGGLSAVPTIAYTTLVGGASIAASIKAVVQGIKQIKSAGGKGGGSSSVSAPMSTGGGATPPPPPLAPQVNTQMINEGQINQLASATARAYVVESDVSGNQERIQRLNRAARIN
jgi:hypothetical protein